jgi:hypothetical protein
MNYIRFPMLASRPESLPRVAQRIVLAVPAVKAAQLFLFPPTYTESQHE